jgi:hypothetical protein
MDGNDMVAGVEAALAVGTAKFREALLQWLLRRKAAVPFQLTQRLLKDADPTARRIAMMRLVRDSDLATSAGCFKAAVVSDEYCPDIAIGLAELLASRKSDPAVRDAFAAWRWSARRWGSILGLGSSKTRKVG